MSMNDALDAFLVQLNGSCKLYDRIYDDCDGFACGFAANTCFVPFNPDPRDSDS